MIAALAVLWFGSTPSETWRVLGVSGPMQVTLDGDEVDLPAGTLLDGGSFVVGDSTEVELEWGALRLRLRPGTEVTVPAPPGRWFGRKRALHLTAGEAYGSSGLAGVGFDLRLQTPEAEARLLGTTFAVFRTADATCFCLYRGGLEVTPRGGESFELPVQRRVYIYDDGRAPSIEALDAGETMKLRMVDDAALAP
jgi:ferric-dicitrate binding protein FerR (iron transport regulator)